MLQEKLLAGVDRDLAPFKESGITLEMVEQVYCTYNVQSFRVQVCSKCSYPISVQLTG